MTGDDRRARIAEIFGLLDGVPAEAADERIALCREALGLMTPDEAASEAGGWLEFELGKAYYRRLAGSNRVVDLEAAIVAFTAALATWTPESQPVNWPAAQENLGVAYSDRQRLTGSRQDEHAALEAFHAALTVLDPRYSPVAWAQAMRSLGVHHLQRAEGNRAEIIDEAVQCLEQAGEVQAALELTADCALTLADLGIAYRERVTGDRSDNLEKSLACFDMALDALDSDSDSDHGDASAIGQILLHRAETLRYRIAGQWAENIERAYADARRASELISAERAPLLWADAQEELGNVLRLRAAGDRAENQEAGIAAYRQALALYSREAVPQRWAVIGFHLAHALTERLRGERVTDLEEALDLLRDAAESLRAVPGSLVYPPVLTGLGVVYLRRRRGRPADNAEAAWRYLTEALDLEERLGLPPRTRAAVLNALGSAALARETEDPEQRFEDAIDYYERGLDLAGPEEGQLQARLLSNLAAAYAQRLRGDRAANADRSLQLYEKVSAFRTRERAPVEWAETRCNIAAVLADHTDPPRRDQATAAFREALEVLRESGPTTSVLMAARNLGYLGVLEGRWEDAVDGYGTALDAADARYRQSVRLEARFDELTDTTGLSAGAGRRTGEPGAGRRRRLRCAGTGAARGGHAGERPDAVAR